MSVTLTTLESLQLIAECFTKINSDIPLKISTEGEGLLIEWEDIDQRLYITSTLDKNLEVDVFTYTVTMCNTIQFTARISGRGMTTKKLLFHLWEVLEYGLDPYCMLESLYKYNLEEFSNIKGIVNDFADTMENG